MTFCAMMFSLMSSHFNPREASLLEPVSKGAPVRGQSIDPESHAQGAA
jgi:hypothetical protein